MHRSSLLGKRRIGLEIHITGMSEPGVQRGVRTPNFGNSIKTYLKGEGEGVRKIMPPTFSDLPAALD